MKKILILSLLISSLSSFSQSKVFGKGEPENNTFKKGQIDLNVGLGLGAYGGYYGARGYRSTVTPPLNASLDYGITKNISIGGCLAYTRARLRYTDTYTYIENNLVKTYTYNDVHTWNYFIVGLRGAYHFAELIHVENLDIYAGGMVGNAFSTYSYSSDNTSFGRNTNQIISRGSSTRIIIGAYAGARYRFNEKFGVYAELGYGLSYLNTGLNVKF